MKITLVAQNAHYMHTNLALMYIADSLNMYNLCIIDGNINQPFDMALDDILRTQPDIVGLSCYIWNIDRMIKLARCIKRAYPAIRIVLGGPEVERDVEHYAYILPEIERILIGDGCASWQEYLNANSLSDGIPDVYAHRIMVEPYRIWYVETSRGCTNRCAYCLSSAQDDYFELPAKDALNRLIHLSSIGAKLIKLIDRTYNSNLARAHEIWRGLIAARPNSTFHFELLGEKLTDESFEILTTAPHGLFQFEIGVQTTNASVLHNIGRRQDTGVLLENILRLKNLGNIHIHADLIAGLPGEDYASFARSFDKVYASKPHNIQLGFLKLLRGSRLRENAAERGIIYSPDAPYAVLCTREMSFDDLRRLRGVEKAVDWYANSGIFSACIALAERRFAPFALFENLAEHLSKTGAFDANRSLKYKASALRDWLLIYHEKQPVDECILKDMLASSHPQEVPREVNDPSLHSE